MSSNRGCLFRARSYWKNNMSVYSCEAQSLVKSFASVEAVRGVSLKVKTGEIYGLIGPDGAGKTTLLRMLTGILTPDSGESSLCGYSSQNEHEQLKDNVAYMSQKFGLYQDLTVYENIRLYADLYGVKSSERKNRIDELLDFSYMRPFRDRRAGKLSGGMKQKLQLICALIHKPKILLLDEPTNGVDPVSRRDFWRILYKLAADRVTILVSTAYLDEAERCTRIGLMNMGKIIAEGSPHEVIENSGLSVAAVKLKDNKNGAGELKKLFPDKSVHMFGEKIRINTENYAETEKDLKDSGLEIMSLSQEQPVLEDIFMSLQKTGGTDAKLLSLVSQGVVKHTGSSVVTEKITKRFGDFTAVNAVDLDVSFGEIYGFLGPNGAGKSTTIRMLCGLLSPTEGKGTVAGFDIAKQSERIKENIGYMSQKFSLYEDLKIYENIDFYGGIYGLSGQKLQKRREWALELSGLSELKDELTENLTGGWRQRLALACSILHSPSIVFLDEPTSGADPASRRLFWEIITNLASSGVTVFVSTHYMEEAEYCDRLAMIFRGNMIAEGTPMSLKKNSMTDSILNISIPEPQQYIDELSKLPEINNIALFGAGLHARTNQPEKAESSISRYFADKGERAETKRILPSMEDVFVSLIDTAEGNNGS